MHFARRRGTSLRSQPRQKSNPICSPSTRQLKSIAMPNPPRERKRARELAAEFVAQGNPTGWFEALYRDHPQKINGPALVVGCGLGDDAEQLATWGFQTTAFDISQTAIRAAKKR